MGDEKGSKMNTENEKLKLHFIYLVSILVFVLVIVSTGLWTNQEKFTEFLGNAATMTSLVLGLVAIFYSFISNDGLSKSLGNILLVSDEIRRFKDQISEFIIQAKDINENEGSNVKKLEEASASVATVVNELSGALSAITERTALLQESVAVLPSRFEQLENRFDEVSKNNTVPNDTASTLNHWTSDDVKQFLERSSLSANLLTYACCIASRKKIEISPDKVAEVLGTNNKNFLHGFFWSMYACGLITRSSVRSKDRTYKINLISDELQEKMVKDYFTNYIENYYASDDDDKDIWLKRMASIASEF